MSEFDDVQKINKQNQEAAQKRAVAFHDVFVKSESGRTILAEWVNLYCMSGVPGNNASEREVGKRDGKQELIKSIIDQINIATGEKRK